MATVITKKINRNNDRVQAVLRDRVGKGRVAVLRDTVEKYLKFHKQRADLESQARQIAKKEQALASELREYVEGKLEEAGAEIGTVEIGGLGYALKLSEGGRYPRWKEEFIRVAGQAAADEVSAETLPSISFSVEKIDPFR